jgi:hypothetical protein
MLRNVGPEDRVVRIVVAIGLAILIYVADLSTPVEIILGIVAAYLLLTGLLTRCPFYRMIGVDTGIQEQPYSSSDDRAGL